MKGDRAIKFRGNKTGCLTCELRTKCLRYPDRTETRQVYFFQGPPPSEPESFTEKLTQKIDSVESRITHNRRLAAVGPAFANVCSTLGLDKFAQRSRHTVNIQWLVYCMVRNLLKGNRYGCEEEH